MLAQRRPHVILRIGNPELPQEARNGPNQRHLAPAQSGGEHERVIAVALGGLRHDDEETGLQPAFRRRQVDRLPGGAFEFHVMKPDLRRLGRPDVVGAFVDDAEIHIFQDRHALRQ